MQYIIQDHQEEEGNRSITAVESANSAPLTFARVTNGFKVVIDNLDKNIRASFQRIDRSTLSLHFIHAYGALDNIDFSGLSDDRPAPKEVDLDKLLPPSADVAEIQKHFSIPISWIVILVVFILIHFYCIEWLLSK